jgi:cytochrome c-type biogenesis protein CcmH
MKVFCRLGTSSQRKLGSQQVGQDLNFRWDDVLFFILIIFFFLSTNLFALSPEQRLSDSQEQRARELFLQIKCPVCAGQVIESSNTEIAFQLRKLVREKIIEGKSDKEIKAYLVAEYGEDVLNSPTSNIVNYLLWILPLFFILIGLFVIRKFANNS